MFDKGQKQSSTLSCDSSYYIRSGIVLPMELKTKALICTADLRLCFGISTYPGFPINCCSVIVATFGFNEVMKQ